MEDIFELLLEILQTAEENGEEIKIWGYAPENEYVYGFIDFAFKEENHTMFFEDGTLKEIRKGIV
jgi:hypothetical protein